VNISSSCSTSNLYSSMLPTPPSCLLFLTSKTQIQPSNPAVSTRSALLVTAVTTAVTVLACIFSKMNCPESGFQNLTLPSSPPLIKRLNRLRKARQLISVVASPKPYRRDLSYRSQQLILLSSPALKSVAWAEWG